MKSKSYSSGNLIYVSGVTPKDSDGSWAWKWLKGYASDPGTYVGLSGVALEQAVISKLKRDKSRLRDARGAKRRRLRRAEQGAIRDSFEGQDIWVKNGDEAVRF